MSSGVAWVDGRPLLEAAMQQLAEGQVIKSAELGFMDLISAIDIMDPRTDSYHTMKLRQSDTTAFDPNLELLPGELLWILDEMLKLEVTFHDGHPLISTLFQCQYIRPKAIQRLASGVNRERLQSISSNNTTATLMKQVLLACIMGVVICTEIVWVELCKGQVYENEDVHLSTSCLTFRSLLQAGIINLNLSPPLQASVNPASSSILRFTPQDTHSFESQSQTDTAQEYDVSVDDVLDMLLIAKNAVSKEMEEGPLKNSILNMLGFRIEFLFTLAMLSSLPHTTPSQVGEHLSILLNTVLPSLRAEVIGTSPSSSSIATRSVPSEALKAVFKPGKDSLPLPSPQPVREIEDKLEDMNLVWKEIEGILRGLESAVLLWDNWLLSGVRHSPASEIGDGITSGWPCVREYFIMLGRMNKLEPNGKEKEEIKPFVRSIHQSIVMTSRSLFGQSSPVDLTVSFFECHVLDFDSVKFFNLMMEMRSTETSWNSPARKVLGWYDKLATQALGIGIPGGGVLGWSSQNRARARRGLVKTLGSLKNLIDEWEISLVPVVKQDMNVANCIRESAGEWQSVEASLSAFSWSLRTVLYGCVLEALLSGFELNLYDIAGSGNEWRHVWWVAERTAGYLALIYGRLASCRNSLEPDLTRGEEVEAEPSAFVDAKRLEAESLRWMCRGALLSTYVNPIANTKMTVPFLTRDGTRTSSTVDETQDLKLLLEQSSFERRFEWLSNAGVEFQADCADWTAYHEENRRLEDEEGRDDIIMEGIKAYSKGLEANSQYTAKGPRNTGNSVRPDVFLKWQAALRRMAFGNQSFLKSQIGVESKGTTQRATLHWDSPWFPTYVA